MSSTSNDKGRYQRYERVVTAAASQDAFVLAQLKDACSEESPAFVTRIVGKLEEDGIVERRGTKSHPEFRWIADREEFSGPHWIDSKIYSDRITRAPLDDRPRERLLAQGVENLRLADLLAIVIRAGRPGESALQAGQKIAARYAERLGEMATAGRGELKAMTPAVGDAAYCQIMAAIELGRRVVQSPQAPRQLKIGGSQDAITYCQDRFARLAKDSAQEEFHVLTLDTKNQPIGTHRVSLGVLDQTVVHPREVFRPAIKDAAKSIVLVHNHPSGDPTPSDRDRTLTRRLEEVGRTVGIQVLDHIIVARDGVVSLKEIGLSPNEVDGTT